MWKRKFGVVLILLICSGCQSEKNSGEKKSPIKQSVQQTAQKSSGESTARMNLYWGDLHNHSAVGYAKGSLERAYDIAKSHLDFFCFTPHSQWHDMPQMPQNAHMKWIRGFEVTRKAWPNVVKLANDSYQPGKFVSFIGYEWHSSSCGDVHIVFPGSKGDLRFLPTIEEAQEFAVKNEAILIPHHPGYKQDWRGQNWDVLDTSVSPVVEICSEHGNAESDRSPIRYIRHSMGGRYTRNTLQWLWEQGVQAGVVASTDDHLGYPGAYGEGLVAVYADGLSRDSILDAVRSKRTYGVNADRIALSFKLNDHWMGETIPPAESRKIQVQVEGKDVIDRVELLRNNQVIHRNHPVDNLPGKDKWKEPVLMRIEFGWGPWADLNMARICDWDFTVSLDNGEAVDATPCFQAGPYDEERRNSLLASNDGTYHVQSYTSRKQAYEERATNSVILKIQGSPKTTVTIRMKKPRQMTLTKTLEELTESNDIVFTGPFTSESMMIHRVVFPVQYKTSFEITDRPDSKQTDWYYVRVMQTNGSYAWSSPVWVEN